MSLQGVGIGNWPGVTVEKKVGIVRLGKAELEIVDLPGIYGLTAYSVDEVIARNFIVNERPEVVINIVNASNLERNLYLTVSLLEMGANIIVALNMIDLAEGQGYKVDSELLSKLLNVPVVPMVAVKGIGIEELKKVLLESLKSKRKNVNIIDYGKPVERAIENLKLILDRDRRLAKQYNVRWLAIKLLEDDEEVKRKVIESTVGKEALKYVEKVKSELKTVLGEDVEDYIVEKRYEFVHSIAKAVLKPIKVKALTVTDIVDFVVTHKVFGIPIMLTVLYVAFKFAFDVATPLVDLIDWLFNNLLYTFIANSTLPSVIKSFIADGIVTGIGSILVFLPNIIFLFLFLALLEDIGYMARAAFVVDKIMLKLGLTGKSIIPMIIGFGCNVPAIMAARTIEDENDRKVTALVSPLISCSARLPVYLLFAGVFFSAYQGSIVLSMYVLGVVLAIFMALTFRKLMFKGLSSGFIMELPPYMLPMAKSVAFKTWERTKKFLFKAGTIIFLGVMLTWIMCVTGPSGYLGVEALESPKLIEESWIGILGHTLEPLFKPMGWDWKAIAALFFGFIAKEIVVGSMAILYATGEEGLSAILSQSFTPLTAYAYMAFVLIYVPCLATIAAIRGELGWKYAILTIVYELLLAYIVSLLIVSIGHLIGL